MTLPAGWTTIPAQTAWDGTGSPSYDDAQVDQLIAPVSRGRCAALFECGPLLWAIAAPTTASQPAYVDARVAADKAVHPCATDTKQIPATIDGVSALVRTAHCATATGAFAMSVYLVRRGVGYGFFLIDLSFDRGAEAADRTDFLGFLKQVKLRS